MDEAVSRPTGTMYVFQPISTPSSTSWSYMDFPSALQMMKLRMLRCWKPRTISTAILFEGAGPSSAANPGMRPSTNWIPSSRRIVSEMNPVCPSSMGSLLR